MDFGKMVEAHDKKTKEIIDMTLVLNDPANNVVLFPSRPESFKYLIGELDWYFTGDYDVKGIVKYSKFWEKLADENGHVNSNYGMLVFRDWITDGMIANQFDWCVDALVKDVSSRQAVINFNQLRHKCWNTKDLPCTMSQQFLIRDGKLDCITHMRSQDAIFGFTYDITFFTLVQQMLLAEIGQCCDEYAQLQLGKHTLHVGSFHAYEKHWDLARKMIAETPKIMLLPKVDPSVYADVIGRTHNSQLLKYIKVNLPCEGDQCRIG